MKAAKAYPTIVSKLFYDKLAITPRKHLSICSVIESALAGNNPRAGDWFDNDGDDDEPEIELVNSTQIIRVHGTIARHSDGFQSGGCDLDEINAMIDLADSDPDVKNVIFDFRTPGGEVTGVPETARKIARMSKPTWAFTDSECCSGGIWLAEQCRQFYATPSASVGSIGVWCAYLDISRQMANEGLNMQAISSGKYKLMGAYWKPLTDEEKTILQADVDKTNNQFHAAVQTHRKVSEADMGNGLIFDGEDAAGRGLTDGCVESLDELLDLIEQE